MPRPVLTTAQLRLVGTVAGGAITIAAIGFVGSYAAVRELAEQKDFGTFAAAFPIGIDVGIVVLLALDLLLAWLRMPYPLLRHTAWLLTAATIAFNGAAAWPDPLGTAMHAVIPVLFVVVVEAARNAVGRLADITADKHMDSIRLSRWLLSPVPTFRLWRRMKLWELRSYDQVIHLEQERLVFRAQLQADYGRRWRWKAPVQMRLQLRLARYGRPLPAAAQPTALAVTPLHRGAAAADFERSAAEAVALAPPTLAAAQPQPDAPASAAVQPTTPPQLQLTGWSPPRTLVLDLAPMQPPSAEVTADAQPQPQPAAPAAARVSDEPLVEQAVALAAAGPLSGRRLQRELGIGQRRAPRILAAAEARIRAAAAAPPQPQPQPGVPKAVQPQPSPTASASGAHS
ncbi:Protein of unknown function [Streptomyces sp. ScaeMP-e48]|uniref:DUF2637 domain-containing protein n=1 Tax=Streptomyces sp. ScaeMP-e48 TaxID=1100823 RepID=UPI000823D83B|nr:DUF2637 domain-containing protein [Streptomyces sp. ScaeMP-e48]SCK20214.1 Protein of unknown function [Streptomyces sp. ScaeMP-e48]